MEKIKEVMDTPAKPAAIITTTETKDNRDGADSVRRTTRVDLPETPEGRLARVWLNIGGFGVVIIVFLVLTSSMLWWFISEMQAARQERKDMTDRYIAAQEQHAKRHAEVLAKLDKVVWFIELQGKQVQKSFSELAKEIK